MDSPSGAVFSALGPWLQVLELFQTLMMLVEVSGDPKYTPKNSGYLL